MRRLFPLIYFVRANCTVEETVMFGLDDNLEIDSDDEIDFSDDETVPFVQNFLEIFEGDNN